MVSKVTIFSTANHVYSLGEAKIFLQKFVIKIKNQRKYVNVQIVTYAASYGVFPLPDSNSEADSEADSDANGFNSNVQNCFH